MPRQMRLKKIRKNRPLRLFRQYGLFFSCVSFQAPAKNLRIIGQIGQYSRFRRLVIFRCLFTRKQQSPAFYLPLLLQILAQWLRA